MANSLKISNQAFIIFIAIQTILSLIIDDEQLKYRTTGWVAAALGFLNFFLLTPLVFTVINISNIFFAVTNTIKD